MKRHQENERHRLDRGRSSFDVPLSRERGGKTNVGPKAASARPRLSARYEKADQPPRSQCRSSRRGIASAFRVLLRGLLRYQNLERSLESGEAAAVVSDTVEEFRADAASASREVVCEIVPSSPPIRAARESLARALLWNLLENAVKYSDGGTPIRVFARPPGRIRAARRGRITEPASRNRSRPGAPASEALASGSHW